MSHSDDPQSSRRLSADQVVDGLRTATQSENDAQLARWLGIPQTTVSGWRKRSVIPYDACARVAEKTGLSLDGLVFGEQRPPQINVGTVHKVLFEWAALRVFESRFTQELEEEISEVIELYNDIMLFSGGGNNMEWLAEYEKRAQARKAERARQPSKA